MAASKKTFDARMAELEAILPRMEEGQLSLEETLKLYEQGVKLHKALSAELDTAEKRLLDLTDSGLAPMEDAP